jgi:catechol 2,3-dioxygenase-like lactoylglutathione lyase family enzyme
VSLRGFSTINFWADDVAAAVAWYAEFLGVEAYFTRSKPDGRLAYAEFRIGDYQDELGIIDRSYGPPGATTEPGGAIMYWPRGEAGFVTAAVVDPFGNVLGVMYNPHYLEVLEATKPA